MLLPAAAHKGYGLSLLVELLAACLTGAGSVGVPDSGYRLGNGMFMQAFDVGRSCRSRTSPRAPSRSPRRCVPPHPAEGYDAVLLPGDPERLRPPSRRGRGVDVAASTWEAIVSEAAGLGVAL